MNLGFLASQEITLLLLSPFSKLRSLDLKKNPLGDKGVTILMHGLKRSKQIYKVDLSSTGVTYKGGQRIFKSLRNNQSITSLSLGCIDGAFRNMVGLRGLAEFQNMLKTNQFLNILDLSSNRIMNDGFHSLIMSIEN